MTPPNSDDRHQGRPVVSVRVDKPVNERLEGLIGGDDTKADVTREVIRRGIAACELGAEPRALAERAEKLEEELDRGVIERLDWPGRLLLGGAFLATLGLVLVLGPFAAQELGVLPEVVDPIATAGLLAALVGAGVFTLGGVWSAARSLLRAIAPDI